MIKLIASDMDGTLLTEDKNFPPDFFEILQKLKNKNVYFTAASGRSCYSLKKIFVPNHNDIYYISDNGAYISGKDIDIVNYPLTSKEVDTVLKELLKIEDIQIILCGKNKAYFINSKDEYLKDVTVYYVTYECIEALQKIDDEILKIAVFDPKGSAVYSFPKIENKLPKNLTGIISAQNWFDIMNKNVNKGAALELLQKHLKVTFDETMAFGDFDNDIEMLKNAKFSYAMANSSDKVKKCALYQAECNNSFGVIKAIKEKVL